MKWKNLKVFSVEKFLGGSSLEMSEAALHYSKPAKEHQTGCKVSLGSL